MYASLVYLIPYFSSRPALLVAVTAFICRPFFLFHTIRLFVVDGILGGLSVDPGFSFFYVLSHTSLLMLCFVVWYSERLFQGAIRCVPRGHCSATAAPLSHDSSSGTASFVVSSCERKTSPSYVKAGSEGRISSRTEQNGMLVSADKSSSTRGNRSDTNRSDTNRTSGDELSTTSTSRKVCKQIETGPVRCLGCEQGMRPTRGVAPKRELSIVKLEGVAIAPRPTTVRRMHCVPSLEIVEMRQMVVNCRPRPLREADERKGGDEGNMERSGVGDAVTIVTEAVACGPPAIESGKKEKLSEQDGRGEAKIDRGAVVTRIRGVERQEWVRPRDECVGGRETQERTRVGVTETRRILRKLQRCGKASRVKGIARRPVLWRRTEETVMRQVHESMCRKKRTRRMVRADAIARGTLWRGDSEVAFCAGTAPMSRPRPDSNGLLENKGDRVAPASKVRVIRRARRTMPRQCPPPKMAVFERVEEGEDSEEERDEQGKRKKKALSRD